VPAKLTLFPTQGPSRYFVFPEGKNHFAGRDPSSDLLLEDPRVSARHALFQWTGADWILVDLRSKNGTFVNSAAITEIPLQDEDWINFGGLLARFERISEKELDRLLAERAERLQGFVEARRELDSALDERTLVARLLASGLALVGGERGFLLLWTSDGTLVAAVASGYPPYEPVDETFQYTFETIERALQTGRATVSSRTRAESASGRRRRLAEMGIETRACVPLKAGARVRGLIVTEGRRGAGVYSELDMELLDSLAAHAGIVLGGKPLGETMRELLDVDSTLPATGGTFLEEIERRVAQIARTAADSVRPTF
jgi:pSer/pThr/pTyr-binding forkhead associated (FHA) protein